tara:strand:- start:109 stop:426 length:318 start_codon:yes stop_codon:yes gene_type:complete
MEVYYDDVLDYLKINNTSIDAILKHQSNSEEIEKKPSQEYIQEIKNMDDRERNRQMQFEQQLSLLITMNQMSQKKDVYLNSKCLSDSIKMYQQMQKMREQMEEQM